MIVASLLVIIEGRGISTGCLNRSIEGEIRERRLPTRSRLSTSLARQSRVRWRLHRVGSHAHVGVRGRSTGDRSGSLQVLGTRWRDATWLEELVHDLHLRQHRVREMVQRALAVRRRDLDRQAQRDAGGQHVRVRGVVGQRQVEHVHAGDQARVEGRHEGFVRRQ